VFDRGFREKVNWKVPSPGTPNVSTTALQHERFHN
jgi:hypothetical protein